MKRLVLSLLIIELLSISGYAKQIAVCNGEPDGRFNYCFKYKHNKESELKIKNLGEMYSLGWKLILVSVQRENFQYFYFEK